MILVATGGIRRVVARAWTTLPQVLGQGDSLLDLQKELEDISKTSKVEPASVREIRI